jgi:IclR family KDG regulon transcriptional repressor
MSMTLNKNQNYKTLAALAEVLSLFNDRQVSEMAVTEISKALQMSPSKVSRMLRTLESKQFFEKNTHTGKYRLGIRFLELGILYALHLPLRRIIRPHIEQMAKELNVTASWAILSNSKVIVIDRIQNVTTDMVSHRMGLNLPIYAASVGKVLLAYLPEDEQDRILQSIDLQKLTDTTIVDRKLLKEELERIKERGYSTDQGETHKDLICIGAPLKNGSGDVIAAVSLMEEKSEMSAKNLFQFADYLKEKALFISRQLGYLSDT